MDDSSAITGSFDTKASILENAGSYRSSQELYENALESVRENCSRQLESCDRFLESVVLNNLGFLYNRNNRSSNALPILNEALHICRTLVSCGEEFPAKIYTNIAAAYYGIGNIESAIENVNEAIQIRKSRKDYEGLGRPYWQLGLFYESSGDIEQALDYYQESLMAFRLLSEDREGEARTLKYLGDLWARQGHSDLGAIFLKQSVLVYESIREDNIDLPEELQDSYTKTIESTYRLLATLLIRQGRVYEAQRVLELLKAEELRRFTRATWTNNTLTYEDVEEKVVDAHDSLIALGSKLYACDLDCDPDLVKLRRDLNGQYQDAIRTLEATVSRNLAQDPIFDHPSNLAAEARALVNSKPGTLLIYPIITKDEVWLLWSATGGVVGVVRAPNGIGLKEVGDAVLHLRLKLQNPQDYPLTELKVAAKKLYDWLIAPLAEEIEKNDIEYLIFAQDRFTRYVPMGVLFDGKNYLVEKFTINTVLSAENTDTDETLGESDSSPILALGVEDALKDVSINNENKNFSALPNVEEELSAIVRNNRDPNDQKGFYPGLIFRNKEVTFENIAQNVTRSRILHIATHGEFVPDTDGDSYLLLGDKSILKAAADNDLKDIETLGSEFYNLHLVVLSACETALGGKNLDGTEIAGVSSYFLGTGKAETVLATLWKVDDAGTSVLMQRFYEILATGDATKAEALRHAMLSLLYDEEQITERLAALESGQRGFDLDLPEVSTVESSHPYYWAPFVLIGNGL
ncbi:MAG: CHAT domain-containing protein [Cyanothece sp. SIO1E1]|nr:CHAT domain-containing protein [Cyanothece sp. SIO1E1]